MQGFSKAVSCIGEHLGLVLSADLSARFAPAVEKEGQSWLKRVERGVAYTGINLEDLRTLPIRLPQIEEQQEIANRAKDYFEECDLILQNIQAANITVIKLVSSILQKAFSGELVPQDPNDEPASVLLERIQAQREAEAAAKKPTKRGRKKKADPAKLVIPEGIADNHLARVLKGCGALSERALLAASELEPGAFELQLAKETREALIMRNTEDMYESTNTQTSKEEKSS